eukprot:Skav231097  [mRNA]  locus=scaffold2525:233653:243147:- [translate_table: standard]
MSFVATVLCRDEGTALVQLSDRSASRILIQGCIPDAACQIAALDVVVQMAHPLPTVRVALGSRIEVMRACTKKSLHTVTEMCCGMGCFSAPFGRAGFDVKLGIDKNDAWAELFQAAHVDGESRFLASDAGSTVAVRKMYDLGTDHGVVLAGISCQPFSRLGDSGGMADDRAGSVVEVLRSCWLTQSVLVVLECVPQVLQNKQFQQTLLDYCARTGYHLTQQVLDLQTTWCTRRERWFAVLSAPVMGPCKIDRLPKDDRFKTVGKVLPFVKSWPEEEAQQLKLSGFELGRYIEFAVGGIEATYLKFDEVLPTVLHSAGNQLHPCSCGCRPALSTQRLRDKGLVGTLVQLETFCQMGHEQVQEVRYLHPSEMLLLNGGSPLVDWNGKMRLSLAAVGQCVAPMVAMWIASQLKSFIDGFLCSPTAFAALYAMAWPRALHGVSVVHLGRQHYTGLRAAAMRSLKVNRKGANPVLRLATHGLRFDPEAWSILQTLRDHRQLYDIEAFRQDMVTFWVGSAKTNGPIGILIDRVSSLGWELQSDGSFRDAFGCFQPLAVGWDEVVLRVKLAWPLLLGNEVVHRSSMDGLWDSDLGLVVHQLQSLDEEDQALVRCCLDGTLYTQCGRAHFEDNNEGTCPWCSQPDGFFHRTWLCPFFVQERSEVSDELQQALPSMARCWTCHGWPTSPVELLEWRKMLCVLPVPHASGSLPAGDFPVHHLFVDGSCLFPEDPVLRLASWAVTWANPDAASLDHALLAAGHVRGLLQSSYRGELVAMLVAVSIAVDSAADVVVWSDNDSVVRGMLRLLRWGHKVKPSRPHSDLWGQLHQLCARLRRDQVRVCKVVSHGDPIKAVDEVERWAFWHNHLVDNAARETNKRRPLAFMRQWDRAAEAVAKMRRLALEVWKVQIRVAKKAVASEHSSTPAAAPAAEPAEVEAFVERRPAVWTWAPADEVRYGQRTMLSLRDWWVTTVVAGFDVGSLVWLTWDQLFLSYLAWSGVYGPRYDGRRRVWVCTHQEIQPSEQLTFAKRTRSFQTVVKQLWQQNSFELPSKYTRGAGSMMLVRAYAIRVRVTSDFVEAIDDLVYRLVGGVVRKHCELDGCTQVPLG